MTQKSYMLIVDISGYTAYLSQTELTHAQEILEALMNTLIEHLHPPIIISRVEGDGIFAYTLENCYLQRQTLLEALEHLCCSFAFELEHIKQNTTCTCQACARIPELGLKMIAHYGESGLQKIGDNNDLIGSEVNHTHRLAKNAVKEKTGVSEYAFFTEACIDALHWNDFAEKPMVLHSESYDHIGEVTGYVYGLFPAWQRDKERRRVILSPEETAFKTTIDLSVSPPMAWDYLNDPVGDKVIDQMILDWQPFDLPGNMKTISRYMVTLEEVADGTWLTNHFTKTESTNPQARFMLKMTWNKTKEMMTNGRNFTEKMILEANETKANPEIPRIKMALAA